MQKTKKQKMDEINQGVKVVSNVISKHLGDRGVILWACLDNNGIGSTGSVSTNNLDAVDLGLLSLLISTRISSLSDRFK